MTMTRRATGTTSGVSVEIVDVEGKLTAEQIQPGVFYRLAKVAGPAYVPADFPEHLRSLGASDAIVSAASAAASASASASAASSSSA